MEIIAKVSRGSKMDQVYIPKNRFGLHPGSYVTIQAVAPPKAKETLFFYQVPDLEPIKQKIAQEVFSVIDQNVENYDNLILTGSFLEKGFHFNDLDLLLITSEKIETKLLERTMKNITGIPTQILIMSTKTLLYGLATDPLYQTMLSRCIAKKRLIYRYHRSINYKLLDLHLLGSEALTRECDLLDGQEKYKLARNMVAIYLFLRGKKVTFKSIDSEIQRRLRISSDEIKKNTIDKKAFRKTYQHLYDETFSLILNAAKSQQTHRVAHRKPS
ncbi:MAG TPA: hypothetical protein VJG90_01405 [Candidatus Nanoarchaeia archaeon]|nr:hypothetical protein [Candidatus Nanoarchaeia archaeon]